MLRSPYQQQLQEWQPIELLRQEPIKIAELKAIGRTNDMIIQFGAKGVSRWLSICAVCLSMEDNGRLSQQAAKPGGEAS